ncbi:hypothetical protein SBA3_620022 [Candidatus Sulfopaludibacter sp. SbA3]|nr:hypothetical protein SBA3_620022 [Candidatus Sulfopaludibacter sp. SbA3]
MRAVSIIGEICQEANPTGSPDGLGLWTVAFGPERPDKVHNGPGKHKVQKQKRPPESPVAAFS